MQMKRVLVAGATGYLGRHLVKTLRERGYWVRALLRNAAQRTVCPDAHEYVVAQATQADTLHGIAENIDWVFSTIGITRQKDGLTYMNVDYQANANLLAEAERAHVKAFLYVSALHGAQLRHLKIFEAKERFVEALKKSPIPHCIMRPTGFFSDMKDFLKMARKGRVYLFGKGDWALNPIHGIDLAQACIESMEQQKKEVEIGGPDTFTQNELATLALKSWNKPPKITHIPDVFRRMLIALLPVFTRAQTHGPIVFFLTALAQHNVAPNYGSHHLDAFFEAEVNT